MCLSECIFFETAWFADKSFVDVQFLPVWIHMTAQAQVSQHIFQPRRLYRCQPCINIFHLRHIDFPELSREVDTWPAFLGERLNDPDIVIYIHSHFFIIISHQD